MIRAALRRLVGAELDTHLRVLYVVHCQLPSTVRVGATRGCDGENAALDGARPTRWRPYASTPHVAPHPHGTSASVMPMKSPSSGFVPHVSSSSTAFLFTRTAPRGCGSGAPNQTTAGDRFPSPSL